MSKYLNLPLWTELEDVKLTGNDLFQRDLPLNG